MKKTLFIVALASTVFIRYGFAQDSTKNQASPLLISYYGLKEALTISNADAAATRAGEFIKALNALDKDIVKEDSRNALLSDAGAISKTNNLTIQREKFAALSANMYALAKTTKLSPEPVYLQYCPMKKASWLSSSKAIKNPYYGSAMLTCGSVKETL